MHALHPVINLELWLRWLVAAALLLWLPGHLLVGQWLAGLDRLSRILLAVSCGLLLVPVYAAGPGALGWLHPGPYLGIMLPVTWLLGRWRAHRQVMASWAHEIPSLSRLATVILAATMVLGAVLLLIGNRDMCAPPAAHDASNHAFLTQRIVLTGHANPAVIFDLPAGQPRYLYSPGWHGAAAMIAELGGVAPYVSTWFLPLAAVALMPVAWSLLWRRWRVPTATIPLAAVFAASSELAPGGILGWGGFGMILGLFLLSPVALAVRHAGRDGIWAGALAGMLLGALAQIHASDALMALGAVALISWCDRRVADPGTSADLPEVSKHWSAWAALMICAVLVCGTSFWQVGLSYSRLVQELPGETKEFLDALSRVWTTGFKPAGQQVLVLLGLICAFWVRRLKAVAIVSLVIGFLYMTLTVWCDPVSIWLATPFYRQGPRLLYYLVLLKPPLMAWPLLRVRELVDAHAGRRLSWIVLSMLLLAAVAPVWPRMVRNYSNMKNTVLFREADYHHAAGIAAVTPADAMIANFRFDGSTWAMHVSGRQFLLPCSWELLDPEGDPLQCRLAKLARDLWPPELVDLLQRMSVTHLYIGAEKLNWETGCGINLEAIASDPRFAPILTSANSTLYRLAIDPKN